MKKKNLIIYVLFIMVVMLVPSRVMAVHPTSGSITCTYDIKYRDSVNKEYIATYQINIVDGSIVENGTRWIKDTCSRGTCLKDYATGAYSNYINDSALAQEDNFSTNNGKSWKCPNIATGVAWGNHINAYEVYIANATQADTVKKNIDYQSKDDFAKSFNKSIVGVATNYKAPSKDQQEIKADRTCTYKVGINGKEKNITVTMFDATKTHSVKIDGFSKTTIPGFNSYGSCPKNLKYCIMNGNYDHFVIAGNTSCYDYLTALGDQERLSNYYGQINNLKEGQAITYDADGNQTIVSGDANVTDNINGQNSKELIELITNPIDTTCEAILGDTIGIINEVLNWIKILAPILLILFGSIDFAKAVLADDDKALKKATGDFVKRAIAAAALFFVPLIVNLLLSLDGIKDVVGEALCEGIGKVVIK